MGRLSVLFSDWKSVRIECNFQEKDLIFTNKILYLHYPKTGGMMLTGELLRKLKGPVYYTLPKGHISPRERLLQWTRRIKIVEGKRHGNIEDNRQLLAKIDYPISIEEFEKVIVVIRNPYDYIVSRFHYLQRDQKNNTGPAAKVAAEGDFRKYAIEAPRFYPTEEFLLDKEGSYLSNLEIIKFEEMADRLNIELKPFLKSPISFKRKLNITEHASFQSFISDEEIEAAVYQKFKYLFDNGFYKRITF